MTEHFLKVCVRCHRVSAYRVEASRRNDPVMEKCLAIELREGRAVRCEGKLEALKKIRLKEELADTPYAEEQCLTLPNGECISPFGCVHGPALTMEELQIVLSAEVLLILEPYKKSLKQYVEAARGAYTLSASDIGTARDLTSDYKL